MKITRQQLKRIIREAINSNLRLDATPEEDQEYDLGYEDGVSGLPNDVQNSDYPDIPANSPIMNPKGRVVLHKKRKTPQRQSNIQNQ